MTSADQSDPLVIKLIQRHGGRTPEEAIEHFVTRQLVGLGQNSLPVDVDAMSSAMGIRQRVKEYPFAGRIYCDEDGQLVMDLNKDDPPARRRFTCAHEMLHVAFPGFRQEARYRLDRTTGTYERERALEEYLCDHGAAMLLMPTSIVAAHYKIEDGLAAVKTLKNDAQVSWEAAGIRMVKMSDVPSAFMVLEVGHKPADMKRLRRGEGVEPELRVKYGISNGLPFIPRFKSVARDSVFAEALTSDRVVSRLDVLPGVLAMKVHVEAFCIAGKDSDAGGRVLALAF